MKFIVNMDLDNAAFRDAARSSILHNGEISRLLRLVADKIDRDSFLYVPLRDSNGTTVGEAKFTRS